MADVARRAGFSRTTVSYVLNGRTDVSLPDATRQGILQAAAELGYRPNSIARSLVRSRTQTIGVIVPSLESAFHASIVDGIEAVCAAREYRLLLAYAQRSAADERQQAHLLLENRVEGILNVSRLSREEGGALMEEIAAEGVAGVLLDNEFPGAPADCVVSDDLHGTAQAVRHLLALGHRRIGHISAGSRVSTARDRCAGYRQTLLAAGIEPDPALVVGDTFVPAHAGAWMEQLLDLPEPPTAVFAANDDLAAEAMLAAARRGLRVPKDVAVVGFGDLRMARYLHLTTVHQAPEELGRQAAERLFARIEAPELAPERLVIPTRLVVRKSCGAALR